MKERAREDALKRRALKEVSVALARLRAAVCALTIFHALEDDAATQTFFQELERNCSSGQIEVVIVKFRFVHLACRTKHYLAAILTCNPVMSSHFRLFLVPVGYFVKARELVHGDSRRLPPSPTLLVSQFNFTTGEKASKPTLPALPEVN
ncbi:MAG: hypothetical protein ABSH25_17615 [Syntrophorhabdales bacterium]|jgi:hypothetical protein